MEPPGPQAVEDILKQVENLKTGMREIAHEINNPLGVMRMAAYFLESGNPDAAKRAQYFKVINDSIDKIEASLKKLKMLRDDPSVDFTRHVSQSETDSAPKKSPGT
jgi:nitrogen-specific signal transduction histidine kinase